MPSSSRQWKIWKTNEALLKRARTRLVDISPGKKSEFDRLNSEFDSYISHNEHELALDILEEMGILISPRGGFWKGLEQAAKNMKSPDRIPFFRSEFGKAVARINE